MFVLISISSFAFLMYMLWDRYVRCHHKWKHIGRIGDGINVLYKHKCMYCNKVRWKS